MDFEPFVLNIGTRTLFFQTLELSPYPSKHWIYDLICPNIGQFLWL